MVHRGLLISAILSLAIGCGREEQPLPPTAQPQITEMLRADLEEVPHPADGGGRGWLVEEQSDIPAIASTPGRWTIEYEAGPQGIEVGGMLFLQVSPFWGWSTPQVIYPEAPGYTEVTTTAQGVELAAETADQQLLAIGIQGRRLEPGERIRLVYGAGPAGARADRYAESESRLWLAVDGDGDGRRTVVADSPAVPVAAGPAARLLLHLPSRAAPGGPVELQVAVADHAGNRVNDFVGVVTIEAESLTTGWPQTIDLEAEDGGVARLAIEAPAAGVLRVTGRIGGEQVAEEIEGTSNPLEIGEAPRILWADLHGHSGLSDGTGTPGDYLSYARDVGALDAVALTDHDHWGVEPLATHPELWELIRRETALFHQPGRFVTLLGYEWTNWILGHRHVLYFEDDGEVYSSVDRRFDQPEELWRALRGRSALTFAHHSAGGPVATDWRIAPDPELEPLTEIVSVHGSSEAPDSPSPIYRPLAGNFVRDVLDRGYRLGFVGSGDGHDGHPGLTHLTSPQMGGLTAILGAEPTRESILEALRERRVYATNGPRIVLRATLDGRQMGSLLQAADYADLDIGIVAVSSLEKTEIVRSGRIVETLDCASLLECAGRIRLEDLAAGENVYVRVVQADGGAAWSSPFFIE